MSFITISVCRNVCCFFKHQYWNSWSAVYVYMFAFISFVTRRDCPLQAEHQLTLGQMTGSCPPAAVHIKMNN